MYLIYDNSDELTQLFVGVLLIIFLTYIISANFYYWVKDKFKK